MNIQTNLDSITKQVLYAVNYSNGIIQDSDLNPDSGVFHKQGVKRLVGLSC